MLTGYSNLLNDFPPAVARAGNVSVENFALWLRRYVYQHTRGVFASLCTDCQCMRCIATSSIGISDAACSFQAV